MEARDEKFFERLKKHPVLNDKMLFIDRFFLIKKIIRKKSFANLQIVFAFNKNICRLSFVDLRIDLYEKKQYF